MLFKQFVCTSNCSRLRRVLGLRSVDPDGLALFRNGRRPGQFWQNHDSLRGHQALPAQHLAGIIQGQHCYVRLQSKAPREFHCPIMLILYICEGR